MDKAKLVRILAEKANDSPWRELGKEALKTAVNTLIEEGIEATVEIWKKRRLKIQEEFLEKRDFAAEDEAEATAPDRDRKEYPAGGDGGERDGGGGEASPPDTDTGEDEERAAGAVERPSSRAGIESFGSFVDKKP